MDQTPSTSPSQYIDDEIDLLPYIRHIIAHWRWFVVASIVAVIVAMGLALVLPKEYQASTTFFVPEATTSVGQSGVMAQFGLLSSGVSGQYSGYMMPIFNSRRIKQHVASQLLAEGWFNADPKIKALEGNDQISAVIGKLKFSKYTSLQLKEGVHIITFRHQDPRMVLPVLTAYLTALIELNDELNIDSDRLQIVPLDEAIEPKGAVFPNHKRFVLMAIAMAILGVFGYLVAQKIIKDMVAKA